SRARRHELRRRHHVPEDLPPRRGLQPAGDLARRPRRHRPPARRRPQPLLPGGPRLRPRPLYRRPPAARRRPRHRPRPPRPRHHLRLERSRTPPRLTQDRGRTWWEISDLRVATPSGVIAGRWPRAGVAGGRVTCSPRGSPTAPTTGLGTPHT